MQLKNTFLLPLKNRESLRDMMYIAYNRLIMVVDVNQISVENISRNIFSV